MKSTTKNTRHLRAFAPDVAVRIRCSHCDLMVAASTMQSHMRVMHGLYSEGPGTPIQAIVPDMTHCPDCGVTVRSKNLDRHQRKVHAGISRFVTPTKPREISVTSAQTTNRLLQPQPQPGPQYISPRSGRTGVFYDDESFSVEVDGTFIGAAGSAAEGWQMIEDYKNKPH